MLRSFDFEVLSMIERGHGFGYDVIYLTKSPA